MLGLSQPIKKTTEQHSLRRDRTVPTPQKETRRVKSQMKFKLIEEPHKCIHPPEFCSLEVSSSSWAARRQEVEEVLTIRRLVMIGMMRALPSDPRGGAYDRVVAGDVDVEEQRSSPKLKRGDLQEGSRRCVPTMASRV